MLQINGIEYLIRKDAINYLGLEDTQFKNISQIGQEIEMIKHNRKWYVSKKECDRWLNLYNYRSIFMTQEEYFKCLEFAIRSFYEGAQAKADFLTGEKREIGKYAHNIVIGKMAELALSKFLFKIHHIKILLEFSLISDPSIAFSEDIVKIETKHAIRNPRKNIEVKSSNKTSVHLLIPKSSFDDEDRKNDAFVFVRVHMYMNHLIRFFRDFFDGELREIIREFEPIRAEIVGFAWREDIIEKGDLITAMDGRPLKSGPNYHLLSGQLRCDPADFLELAKSL
jgi:hypothetical protein